MQTVEIPCESHDTLDWSKEIAEARKGVAAGEKIFWKFRLGLERPFFPLGEELLFQSLSLALTHFSKEIWPEFQEVTFGLCLYRGPADLPPIFSWTGRQKEAYSTWILEEELEDTASAKQLYCLEAFAIYFQMLSHRLPDEANIFLLFDVAGFTAPSSLLAALGKERFEHFSLALRGMDLYQVPDSGIPREGFRWEGDSIRFHAIDSFSGLVFPEKRSAAAQFDRALSQMKVPVKVVFESFLSEEWEGLDRLFVLAKELSPQGQRMLKGFESAGGEVVLL
jgi:hypothetical protein